MPVGLQFTSRPFDEAMLFKLAYAYEQGTKHRKPPSMFPECGAPPPGSRRLMEMTPDQAAIDALFNDE